MSKRTKLLIARKWGLLILSWFLLLAPIIGYITYAFVLQGISTFGYIVMIGCIAIALIVWMVNIILKMKLKCPIWIILVGLYFALEPVVKTVVPLFLLLAMATILDELVFAPIINHTRTQIISSKEIDKREKMAEK